MSDPKAKVILAVDVDQLIAGSKRASKAIDDVATSAEKAGKATEKGAKNATEATEKQTKATQRLTDEQERNASKVGNALMVVGAAAVGVAAMATKAASDWESAYAGVRKTVDGTAEEMKVLEGQLRGIAKVAPASHREIAAVAEAAGQLGVAREDVAKFTKTMIDLGVTTNITAEQGAMSIRQFMNIMGSAAGDVDRIASAIVGLGNNSATTEADIMQMAQRLAGAGKQMRMSEAEVLGYAAALASVGIEAEAGGTAMSMTLKQMDAMVRSGGPKLKQLADIAGVSSDEYAAAWGKNAAQATDLFIRGLGRMGAKGEDVNGVLKALGFEGIRQTDSLIRLAGATKAMGGASDLLSDSLRIGTEEFARNTALQIEAQQRYGTTAEKAKIAANQMRDDLITMGNALLPIANQGIQIISDLATAFGALPTPIQQGTMGLIGLAGIMTLTAGGAVKATIAFRNASTALELMGTSMRTVALKGGAVGLALTGIALVIGHFVGQAAQAKRNQEEWATALAETNGEIRDQNGLVHESIRAVAAKRAQDLGLLDLAQSYGLELSVVTDALTGDAKARQQLVGVMDAQIAKQQQLRDQQETATGWEYEDAKLRSEIERRDELVGKIDANVSSLNEEQKARKQLNAATKDGSSASAEDARATAEAARERQQFADATARAVQDLREYVTQVYAASDAQRRALNTELDANQAYLDGKKRIEEWSKAKKTSTDGLAKNTEEGIKNNQALIRLADAAQRNLEGLLAQEGGAEKARAAHEAYRAQLIEVARGFGATKAQAEAYADKLLATPDYITTSVEVKKREAEREVADWQARLGAIPPDKLTQIKALADRGELEKVRAELSELSKTRTATIKVRVSSDGMSAGMGPLYATARAAGALDLPNAHPPHIAPAGAMRLFAEPETGGEAYIPLANDWRRPRAQAILRETASIIGVRTFAAGDLVTPRATTAAATTASTGVADAVREGMAGLTFQLSLDGRVVDARVEAALSSTARGARR